MGNIVMDCRKHHQTNGFFIASFNVVVCLQCMDEGKYSLIVRDAYEMELKKKSIREVEESKKLNDLV